MKYSLLIIVFLLNSAMLMSQVKQAYTIFQNDSTEVDYGKMITSIIDADILFFGELHSDAISHWLQQEVYVDLTKKRSITLGMEMFETDQQVALDSFMLDSIPFQKDLVWSNFDTDYKPLLELARIDSTSVIATNIPRRYASMVFKGGFEALDTLPDADKQWIVPLPVTYDADLPGYKAMLYMFDDEHAHENLPKAQAIKDATMAHNIMKHWKKGDLFYHLNGSYHSDGKEGICWYIQQINPTLTLKTISVVRQKDISALEEEYVGKADFIICIPERMTKSY